MIPKKILILSFEFPPCTGGVARYAYEMALEASKTFQSVTFWTAGYEGDQQFDAAQSFKVVRFSKGTYTTKKIPFLLARILLCKFQKFDLIHAVDWPNIIALAWLNKFSYTPFIATVHGTEIPGLKNSKVAKILGLKEPFAKACRVTTNSHFTKGLLTRYFPSIDHKRIQVTHLGVNTKQFNRQSLQEVEQVRKKWQLPDNHTIFSTVARVDKRKGHQFALEAISQLDPDIQKKISYIIVGKSESNEYLETLKELAARTHARIIFAGELSDEQVKEVYTITDIFCMPGINDGVKVEGFGLSYLEAALYEIPSIASNLHAVPEVILNEETGLLVPQKDCTALSKAMKKLVSDPDYTKKLGQNARRHAESFTWEKCANLTYGNIDSANYR